MADVLSLLYEEIDKQEGDFSPMRPATRNISRSTGQRS